MERGGGFVWKAFMKLLQVNSCFDWVMGLFFEWVNVTFVECFFGGVGDCWFGLCLSNTC